MTAESQIAAAADYHRLPGLPSAVSADASLMDDLNYARFEAGSNTTSGTTVSEVSSIPRDEHTLCT